MISEQESIALKEVLGTRYTNEVRTILLQNKVYTNGVDTYSASHITNVVNGKYENPKIESALYDLAERRKAEKLANTNKRLLIKKT